MKLRLHYWNCRGRAQTLRYIAADLAHDNAQIQYEETFESIETMISAWPDRKVDPHVSGPFGTLPVLHVDDRDVLGQTLSIAHFLAREFRLYGDETPVRLEAQLLGVASCAYSDVIESVCLCIWSQTDLDGPEAYLVPRVRDNLQRLDELLRKSSTSFFYDQRRPTIADYFAFEAFEVAKTVQRRFLPSDHRALAKLAEVMKQRPGLQKVVPLKQFTASPDESDYLQRISKIE